MVKKELLMKNRILIVAAHPDDEVLGCGGTVARLVREGAQASTLIMGEGITSRDPARDRNMRKSELNHLKSCVIHANKELGIKNTFIHDLPDNRFDTVPFLDVVKIVESVVNIVNPSIIFTHFPDDLNIDHGITYNAVLTAARPLPGSCVKSIYAFYVPSSTEWKYPLSFSPNVFFDIEPTLNIKIRAMQRYRNELKKYPHPRSLSGIKVCAQFFGINSGMKYAEPFVCVRELK
jgi:LmbE family N-acetylglucosaminyl deacetylase